MLMPIGKVNDVNGFEFSVPTGKKDQVLYCASERGADILVIRIDRLLIGCNSRSRGIPVATPFDRL